VARWVNVETTVWQLLKDGAEASVRATFRYEPSANPYLVTVTFRKADAETVWEFARDLLAEGIDRHAGIGDVRLWPWRGGRWSRFVALSLSSPDGGALFKVPRSAVVRFLRQSAALVPVGGEEGRIDWDAIVRRMGEEARP
jgi:Streptomyces sporulation and cell division protein, SsgA